MDRRGVAKEEEEGEAEKEEEEGEVTPLPLPPTPMFPVPANGSCPLPTFPRGLLLSSVSSLASRASDGRARVDWVRRELATGPGEVEVEVEVEVADSGKLPGVVTTSACLRIPTDSGRWYNPPTPVSSLMYSLSP